MSEGRPRTLVTLPSVHHWHSASEYLALLASQKRAAATQRKRAERRRLEVARRNVKEQYDDATAAARDAVVAHRHEALRAKQRALQQQQQHKTGADGPPRRPGTSLARSAPQVMAPPLVCPERDSDADGGDSWSQRRPASALEGVAQRPGTQPARVRVRAGSAGAAIVVLPPTRPSSSSVAAPQLPASFGADVQQSELCEKDYCDYEDAMYFDHYGLAHPATPAPAPPCDYSAVAEADPSSGSPPQNAAARTKLRAAAAGVAASSAAVHEPRGLAVLLGEQRPHALAVCRKIEAQRREKIAQQWGEELRRFVGLCEARRSRLVIREQAREREVRGALEREQLQRAGIVAEERGVWGLLARQWEAGLLRAVADDPLNSPELAAALREAVGVAERGGRTARSRRHSDARRTSTSPSPEHKKAAASAATAASTRCGAFGRGELAGPSTATNRSLLVPHSTAASLAVSHTRGAAGEEGDDDTPSLDTENRWGAPHVSAEIPHAVVAAERRCDAVLRAIRARAAVPAAAPAAAEAAVAVVVPRGEEDVGQGRRAKRLAGIEERWATEAQHFSEKLRAELMSKAARPDHKALLSAAAAGAEGKASPQPRGHRAAPMVADKSWWLSLGVAPHDAARLAAAAVSSAEGRALFAATSGREGRGPFDRCSGPPVQTPTVGGVSGGGGGGGRPEGEEGAHFLATTAVFSFSPSRAGEAQQRPSAAAAAELMRWRTIQAPLPPHSFYPDGAAVDLLDGWQEGQLAAVLRWQRTSEFTRVRRGAGARMGGSAAEWLRRRRHTGSAQMSDDSFAFVSSNGSLLTSTSDRPAPAAGPHAVANAPPCAAPPALTPADLRALSVDDHSSAIFAPPPPLLPAPEERERVAASRRHQAAFEAALRRFEGRARHRRRHHCGTPGRHSHDDEEDDEDEDEDEDEDDDETLCADPNVEHTHASPPPPSGSGVPSQAVLLRRRTSTAALEVSAGLGRHSLAATRTSQRSRATDDGGSSAATLEATRGSAQLFRSSSTIALPAAHGEAIAASGGRPGQPCFVSASGEQMSRRPPSEASEQHCDGTACESLTANCSDDDAPGDGDSSGDSSVVEALESAAAPNELPARVPASAASFAPSSPSPPPLAALEEAEWILCEDDLLGWR